MVRVHVLVEGEAEETFVNRVLQPHFAPRGTYLYPRRLGKPGHKRGICRYALARPDILATLKQETATFCTTMFDFYRMPLDWPRRDDAGHKPFAEKSATVEDAILADICGQLGDGFNRSRFIPYVQMHEFEALLFSDPSLLAKGLDLRDDMAVQHIRSQFHSPEEINDSEQTAPSKRIISLNRAYSKVIDGILIVQRIGLNTIRTQC